MHCSNCGKDNRDGAVFCETCGEKLSYEDSHYAYSVSGTAPGGSGEDWEEKSADRDMDPFSQKGEQETLGESWQKQLAHMSEYADSHGKMMEILLRVLTAAGALIYGLWTLGSLRGMLSAIGTTISDSFILYELTSPGYWICMAVRLAGITAFGAVVCLLLLTLGFKRTEDNSRELQAGFMAASAAMGVWSVGTQLLMCMFYWFSLLDAYVNFRFSQNLWTLVFIGGMAFSVELILYLKKEITADELEIKQIKALLPDTIREMKRIFKSV